MKICGSRRSALGSAKAYLYPSYEKNSDWNSIKSASPAATLAAAVGTWSSSSCVLTMQWVQYIQLSGSAATLRLLRQNHLSERSA